MTRTDNHRTTRAGTAPGERPATYLFTPSVRHGASVGLVALAVVAIALSGQVRDDRDGFILVHALIAAPFLVATAAMARVASREGAPGVRFTFRCFHLASLIGLAAAVAALGSVLFSSPVLLAIDMVLLVASVPIWTAGGIDVMRASAGHRDSSVDVIDAAMAVVVFTGPAVLLLAEPVAETSERAFATIFALFLAFVAGGVYSSWINLLRVPRVERTPHILALITIATLAVSVSLQLAHAIDAGSVPSVVAVAAFTVNLACVAALPLWSHRATSTGLGRLPLAEQVRRRNPMPTVSAVVLPLVAVYVLVWRDDTWATTFLLALLVAVVVLNALRHAKLTREARRLSGELARMAEERRQILAGMVRAMDDDRRRTVTELHTQAVGSLSTLGTVVQTACMSLPTDTAAVVREAIAQLQGDLSDRAEELRMLMVAMRPPTFDDAGAATAAGAADRVRNGRGTTATGATDHALSAALRAYASELLDELDGGTKPSVRIVVDPALELDRTTMTIAYRIAQEAMLNAVVHSRGTDVNVSVRGDERAGGIVVKVTDNGVGLDPGSVEEGSGLAALRLFTDLGHGELTVHSLRGGGTLVRSHLGRRADQPVQPPSDQATPGEDDIDAAWASTERPARISRRHLRLLPRFDGSAGPG